MLYGRDAEQHLIDRLLEGAEHGRSGSLVLAGEAGIGKTALLTSAATRVSTACMLQVCGLQAETAMPFAGLHALLHPVREHLPSLSGPQRRALEVALGIESGGVPSRFLVGAAMLELFATIAEQQTVVCLVDDAQWLDPESLSAVVFAARRMHDDRFALLVALRTEGAQGPTQVERLLAGMPRASVGPLDDEAADRLLEDRPSLDPAARLSVKAAAGGHPLALLSLSADGGSPVPTTPLPMADHLAAAYLTRADGLDVSTRWLLLLAAADDTGDLSVLTAAAGSDGDASVLASAEQRALLRVRENRVEFVHPLVRSAIYQLSPSALRREAHLALAEALSVRDPARSTWHRVRGTVPPADDLATELSALAAAASQRGANDLAARSYDRAAELTSDPNRRRKWLLDAAQASWDTGQADRATVLIQKARDVPATTEEPGRIDELRGRLEAQAGSALLGHQILCQGAEAILDSAPDKAADMLMAALRTASIYGDMDRVVSAGELAGQLLDNDHCPASARFAAGIAELLTGTGGRGGVAALREGLRAIHDTNDPQLLSDAAVAALFAGDYGQARLLGTRAATLSRETGSLHILAQALEAVVVAQIDTTPRQAEMNAEEGRRAAHETNQAASEACHLAYLARIAALRGERSSTEGFAQRVFDLDPARHVAFAAQTAILALCVLEVGMGRPEQALRHYETLSSQSGHRAVQQEAADFGILAAVWSGRLDIAKELVATIGSSRWIQDADADWSAAAVNRWRALVSEGDAATALFTRSLDHQARTTRPFYEALTHLLLGEHLRRGRQRMAARPHLRTAAQIFERLDAVPWAMRASSELRATGESMHHADGSARLTPQELQVAQLVATGISTKAVAAQLFLSPRTIDSHLRQIFVKLGVSSRAALHNLDLTE